MREPSKKSVIKWDKGGSRMNLYHFLVLGSEPRQQYLAEFLREKGHEVMEAEEYLPGYHDAVLLPVPQTAVYLARIIDRLQKGQVVFGCNFPEELTREGEAGGISFVDYMEADGVASKNAVATAEGAIAEAVKESDVNLHGHPVLVVGYGRCGEVLAGKLRAMNAVVTVMDRKEEKRSRAQAMGNQSISFEEGVGEMGTFDIIFNTVPAPVITEKYLSRAKKGATVIDIASKPGGVDFDFCQKNGIYAKLCLGLPGKYAPKSSAGILMEVIEKYYGEKNRAWATKSSEPLVLP